MIAESLRNTSMKKGGPEIFEKISNTHLYKFLNVSEILTCFGNFQKKIKNFMDDFFRSTKLIFRALTNE